MLLNMQLSFHGSSCMLLCYPFLVKGVTLVALKFVYVIKVCFSDAFCFQQLSIVKLNPNKNFLPKSCHCFSK